MWRLAIVLLVGCGRLGFEPEAGAGEGQGGGPGAPGAPDATSSGPCTLGPWQAPHRLAALATTLDERAPALSADKRTLFFESNRAGSRDLYVATRTSLEEDFGPPAELDATSSFADDRDPTLSDDGDTLYFTSDRDGPPVLYRAIRSSASEAFGAATQVSELATVWLAGPALSATGAELFYSDTTETVVIRATYTALTGFVPDGSETTLLAAPVGSPSVSGDGLWLFYHHKTSLIAPYAIYVAHRTSTTAEFGPSMAVSELVAPSSNTTDPEISKDGKTIVFASDRPGGAGMFDLYIAERDCL